MLKRTLTALLLTVLATTAAVTAQAPGANIVRATAMLRIERSPNPVSNQAQYYAHLAVEAAKQWLVQHGYLEDGDFGFTVYNTGNGLVAVVSIPGGPDVITVLGPGPFIPGPEQDWVDIPMTAVVRTIYNGF